MSYRNTKEVTSKRGFVSTRRVYECESCDGCPLKEKCTRASTRDAPGFKRRLQIGVELEALKKTAHDLLMSPRGKEFRSKRPVEVEAVFGRLKHNWGFRRFLLRGLDKVKTEWGILCIAHNMAKVAVQ